VLVGKALRRILAAGVKKVIATDTIEHKTSVISVAPLIAEAIR
jgi:phosphoribosylpyrophosphate synthetase